MRRPELTRLMARQLRDHQRGKLGRREFLTRITAAGLSSSAALSLIGGTVRAQTPAAPGGTLRIQQDVRPLKDPRTADWSPIANITRGWLEYLVEAQDDGALRGMLLENWDANEDASRYTLRVRPGVLWSDGSALTAEHVAWLFDYWADASVEGNSMAARVSGLVDPGTGALRPGAVSIADPLTVTLELASPDAAFMSNLADYPAAVVHPSHTGPATAATLGTGPYRLTEMVPGERAVLTRAIDRPWWGETATGWGGATLQTIEYLDLGTDPATWVAALEDGTVDMLYQNVNEFNDVADAKGFVRHEVESAATVVLRFNQVAQVAGVTPYGTPEVRRAISEAISNEVLLELGYGNLGTLGENHHVAPVQPDYASIGLPRFAPGDAARMLSDLGAANFEHRIVSADDGFMRNTAAAAVAQLSDAGISARQIVVPVEEYWDQWKDFPLSVTEWNHRPLGIQTLSLAYRSTSPWNETSYANPAFDALLDRALATPDAATRRPLMEELQGILRADAVIVQPYWRRLTRHSREGVVGADMHPSFEIHPYRLGLVG